MTPRCAFGNVSTGNGFLLGDVRVAKRTFIDGVYVLTREIARGGMSVVCEADVDLNRFDYTTLYAYTQVQGAAHVERRRKAEGLAKELHGRPLDPATVRNLLEAHGIPVPGPTVAVKVGRDDIDPARLEAEWKNLLCLSHPNVIEVYGGGVYMKRPYYAMELVRDVVPPEEVKNKLSIAHKVALLIEAAGGLSYLHGQGIIHRDLKPANLLVYEVTPGQYGVKVVDLGLAKSLGSESGLTRTETVMGTPHYMSPEQMASSKRADQRSDIYGLGATLYELMTGERPFSNKTTLYEVIAAVTAGEHPRPAREAAPDLPEVLEGIIECAMARDPAERYQDMNAFAKDLRTYLAGEETQLLSGPSFADVDTTQSKPKVGDGEYVFEIREEEAASPSVPPEPFLPDATTISPKPPGRRPVPHPRPKGSRRTSLIAGVATLAIVAIVGVAALLMRGPGPVGPAANATTAGAPVGPSPEAPPPGNTPPTPAGDTSTNSLGMEFVRIKADEAYDANRFEEALRLYDEAIIVLTQEREKTGSTELDAVIETIRQRRSLVQFIMKRATLPLAHRIEVTQAKLAELNPGYTGEGQFEAQGDRITYAELEESHISDISALKGLRLTRLSLFYTRVADLSPLRGMALELLYMCPPSTNTPLDIRDITPLSGMPLTQLVLSFTRLTDIAPLVDMPLRSLKLKRAPIEDFAPLKELSLDTLDLMGTPIRDLSVLEGMALKQLFIDNLSLIHI